jgi:phospholipid/cholesterol/gamma-HCH transport system substrate-binding protein
LKGVLLNGHYYCISISFSDHLTLTSPTVTNEERTDIKVGLTVLVGVAILLVGIAWAKQWDLGSHEAVVTAIFPTAGGLEPGDPVMIRGMKRGIVTSVQPTDTGATVSFKLNAPTDLRKDATASISMLELMSGKKVEVFPGISPELLPKGQAIRGAFAGDISSLVSMVTAFSGTFASIATQADTLLTSLNAIIRDDTMKLKLNKTITLADNTLTDVDAAASRAATLLSRDGPAITQTLSDADSALHALSSTLGENRAGIRVLIDSGGRAIADARAAMARVDSLLASGDRKNSLLYRLTKDEGFATRLDSTVTSLQKLLEQIRLQGIDANIRLFKSSTPAP